MFELITEAQLQKGARVTAVVINYSVGGHFHGNPVAFTKSLIFDGINPANGEPKWLEPYLEITATTYATERTRPYEHQNNWFVIGILPDRVSCGKENAYKGTCVWKNMFKVTEYLEDSE